MLFLQPIDSKTLTPEFQESLKRTDEMLNSVDWSKVRNALPPMKIRETPLLTKIKHIGGSRTMRRSKRRNHTHKK